MAFDEGLAERVRDVLIDHGEIVEKRMFGGLAFMLHGNMCCGVIGEELMVRLGNEGADEARQEPHVREMDFTGRPIRSMVYVGPEGVASDEDLASWVQRGLVFASSLPAK